MVNTVESFPVIDEAHVDVLLVFINICNVITDVTILKETSLDIWQLLFDD